MKRRKKVLISFLCLLTVCLSILTACDKNNQATKDSTETNTQSKEEWLKENIEDEEVLERITEFFPKGHIFAAEKAIYLTDEAEYEEEDGKIYLEIELEVLNINDTNLDILSAIEHDLIVTDDSLNAKPLLLANKDKINKDLQAKTHDDITLKYLINDKDKLAFMFVNPEVSAIDSENVEKEILAVDDFEKDKDYFLNDPATTTLGDLNVEALKIPAYNEWKSNK